MGTGENMEKIYYLPGCALPGLNRRFFAVNSIFFSDVRKGVFCRLLILIRVLTSFASIRFPVATGKLSRSETSLERRTFLARRDIRRLSKKTHYIGLFFEKTGGYGKEFRF